MKITYRTFNVDIPVGADREITEVTIPPTVEVQPTSFGRFADFTTERAAEGYIYESDAMMAVQVKRQDVIESANQLYSSPFTPGLWYITSSLDNSRSNLFISNVLRLAYTLYNKYGYPLSSNPAVSSKRRTFYAEPELVYVSGSYRFLDQFLQRRRDHSWPIVLGLIGFDADSTESKREILRDLVNAATSQDITILVGATGCNPHQLHYDSLRIAPTNTINFGYPDLSKSIDL